ncbi:MAG: glycosylasparaginase [Lentimicrobiaceae bacterium]|jgi:N4-(beta-N-acetylglucosaminyl)-L-asparaginase|nr:glycosylasparaginase [Lentimicrobiaceae bacterium]MDG1901117.1 N(4)-(beta-N-acetylglucosaminyl)-L-asparaginase [Bacteroidales bacterium]MDG2080553.1 N(4)-(beta-N-acetylglucosaminyl)-L-asparaginase [Bacteroidales bacterium]|tara:strand:- start:6220 stop:7215 length:996 start_codon:yes stop_codon:yes gene_type:complete
MINRRKFLEQTSVAGALTLIPGVLKSASLNSKIPSVSNKPVVISTWNHGLESNEAVIKVLNNGGSIVDAVEQGVWIPEADPENMSVGRGGLPDIEGVVTLDASIMGPDGNAGSVCFLEDIVHPISVARLIMDSTPHVMLSGQGAQDFAIKNGFKRENLLTEKAKKAWEKEIKKRDYNPAINWENAPNHYHDTIGLLAIDAKGDMAGACTTSGLGFKQRGRVGDSPIIGAGLFVDNEVGGATATGMGELVMKTVGSFLVVELMRNGKTPQQAVEEAVIRIVKKVPDHLSYQIGFIAMNKAGETGAYCLKPGFNYALYKNDKNQLIDSKSYYD